MQIIDTFATHVTERIEPVVKVADRRPGLLLNELRNLVVTPQWEQHLRRVLDAWAEAAEGREADPGIWISGFFGSGKSLLMKVLGVVLEGGELQGEAVHDVFLSRIPETSSDRGEIKRLLTVIRRKVSTSFVGGNIHALQSMSSESLALIAFKLFAKEQDYTNNWAFAWAIEYYIDQAGKKREFQRRAEDLTNKDWEDLKEDTAFHIDKLMQAAADTLPQHFEGGRDAVQRTLAATTQAGINPSDVVDRFVRWCRSRDAEGHRHKILIQLDEIGQWIASGDSNERIMQVQALVETAATRGDGRVWIAVTAHGDIQQAVQQNVQQDQYAKINQRFSQKIKLSNDDMSQVVEERLLQKKDVGQADLAARFASRSGQITDLGSLKNSRHAYPVPSTETFPLCYPFLPWTIKVIPDIVKGVAQAAGRGDALSGATRTMIAVVQGAILDTPGLLQAQIGKLLNVTDLYQQLVVDVPVETKTDLNSIKTSVPGASELTVKVATALYLIGQARHIPCTIENLSRGMVASLDDNLVALAAQIAPELTRLVEAGYAKQVGDEYEFLTTQQRSFQSSVREAQNDLLLQNNKLSLGLKEFESDDIFQLQSIQALGRPLNLKLMIDGRQVKPGQSRVTVHVFSPIQRALDANIANDEALRQKSNQEPETFFFRMDESKSLRTALALYLATSEVADRVIGANPMGPEAEVARQAKVSDLNSHRTAVRRHLQAAMRGAQLFFRGSSYHLSGGASAGDSARALLVQLLPTVYSRLHEVQHRVQNEESAVRAALNGSKNMDIELLSVLKADGTLNESSPLLSAVRGVLPPENSDRPAIEAVELRRIFEDPPYGWDGNVIKVALALMLRAGMCKLVVDGRPITDPMSVDAQPALTRDQKFRALRVLGVRSEVDPKQLITIRGFFETLFGKRPALVAATMNAALGEELARLQARSAALQQWAATANFPLPAAFDAGASVVGELIANPNQVVRLPHFAERFGDLNALLELFDALEAFRQQHGAAFQRARDYFTSMINANLQVSELQLFLSSWNALQADRRFHDTQRWQEVMRARDAAELAVAARVERWAAEARQRAEETTARVPGFVRELGASEAQVVEHAPRLAAPFTMFLADLPAQPTLATTRALATRLDMLDLDLRGELEKLREQYNPKPKEEGDTTSGWKTGSDNRVTGNSSVGKEIIIKAIKARQGQPEFRSKLLTVFNHRCLVTGCAVEDALEAAHINPYSTSQDHDPANGLILRADVHTLFDLGLLAIDTKQRKVILKAGLEQSYADLLTRMLEFPDDEGNSARLKALDLHRQDAGL